VIVGGRRPSPDAPCPRSTDFRPGRSPGAARRRTRSLGLLVAIAAALLLGTLAPAAGVLPVASADAAATDLTLVTDAVYTVQPDRHRAHVAVTIVARNHLAETRTKKFYFDHAYLALPPSARRLAISGAKGASVQVSKRTKRSLLIRIDFGPRLYSGQSRTFRLTFDLVDKGGAGDRELRVGVSLVTLPVWAYASQGARGSTVRVRFPAGYRIAVESGTFASQTVGAGGATALASGTLGSPLTFFAYVSGQREVAYADSQLSIPMTGRPAQLTLRSWADDHTWSKRTGALFSKALPALRDAIGIDWPASEPTVVQEAISRAAGGYAGRFDPIDQRIEVAYWADPMVAVHEAAHGWFNGALLADRWAAEGFASLYAQRVGATIKAAGSSPKLTDAVAAAAIPLNAWGPATEQGAESPTEAYGFAASLALAKAIADRAGDDALRQVWADAAAGVGAYQPPAPGAAGSAAGAAGSAASAPGATGTTGADPEPAPGVPDWRGLLDLLEAHTGKDFTDLWRQWVVRPDEAALLDTRAAAHQTYERTLAVASGWALPRDIRDDLRAWQFDAAVGRMADARTVLAQRATVEELARRASLMLPATMRQLFEAGMLAQASAEAEAERNAIVAIKQATDARGAATDVLTQIGMLGEDPDAGIVLARSDLAAGNIDGTFAAADDAYQAWNGAWQEGRRRMLFGLAMLATLLVLASAAIGRRRRARRDRAFSHAQAHRMRP
jgi:hypothetical protein